MSINLDERAMRNIMTVKPRLQKVCLVAAHIADRPFTIVQGNRTQAEQDAIYAQGRTKPGHIVTWTRHSKHIGGAAVDFAVLDHHGHIDWTDSKYPAIAKFFREASNETGIGIEWGGEWRSKDWGHIQLNPLRDTKKQDDSVSPGVV